MSMAGANRLPSSFIPKSGTALRDEAIAARLRAKARVLFMRESAEAALDDAAPSKSRA